MKKAVFITLTCILVVVVLVFGVAMIYFNYVTRDTSLDLEQLERKNPTIVLDYADNIVSGVSYLTYDEIPKIVRDSFVAVEDKRYYSHNGIDIKRMASAFAYNVRHGRHAQGASTITQQFIKNTYLTNKKTFDRKLKEIKLAILLEKELSKEEILERYLNSLYFGNGIYGIKNASLEIFGKKVDDLSISEIATLVGIIKAPSYYSPINDIERSRKRRNVVLGVMEDANLIDANTCNMAKNSDIILNNSVINSNIADFYNRQVYIEASSILGMSVSELMNKGFRIATYYDSSAQESLVYSIVSASSNLADCTTLAMMSDNNSYGIKCAYGNANVDVFTHYRQAGSVMKPIAVYAPALDVGMLSPATIYDDSPITIGEYTPRNYRNVYRGKISTREAVMRSSNVIPVQILDKLGIHKAKSYLNNMDIDLPDTGVAIALGGLEKGITPIELIGAYSTLANSGKYAKNTFIRYISDENGNIIYRHTPKIQEVFRASSAYLMTDMLIDTARLGTARKLSVLPYEIASKTGTVASIDDSNMNTDAYNMSYTSQDTLFVWLGGKLDSSIQGGGLPTLITREIYSKYYSGNAPQRFAMPSNVKRCLIDSNIYNNTGNIYLTDDMNNGRYELFDVEYMPQYKVVTSNDITYEVGTEYISLHGVRGSHVRLYHSNMLGGGRTLMSEIYSANGDTNIPYRRSIFDKYTIEIYFGGELIKTIQIG